MRFPVVGPLLVVVAALPAVAQTTITGTGPPGGWWPQTQAHTPTGYPDLDRAVAICEAHQAAMLRWSQAIPPPTYLPGYEGCPRVMAKRDTTEQANREREAKAREETDRKFLDGFVERLR